MPDVDLGTTPLRTLNAALHGLRQDTNERHWIIANPAGRHAIAAGLAEGLDVDAAIDRAKAYVSRAIAGGAGWRLGAGHGPLDHLGWSSA